MPPTPPPGMPNYIPFEEWQRRKNRFVRWRNRSIQATAFVGMAWLIASWLGPPLARGQMLAASAAAIEKQASVHLISWDIDSAGKESRRTEEWLQGGRWAAERANDGFWYASTDGGAVVQTPDLPAVVSPDNNPQVPRVTPIVARLPKILQAFAPWSERGSVQDLGTETVNGKKCVRLRLSATAVRTTVWIESGTNLLRRLERERRWIRGWQPFLGCEVSYGDPVPSRMVALPQAPRPNEFLAQYLKSRATPLAELTLGGATSRLLDAHISEAGIVFLTFDVRRIEGGPTSLGVAVQSPTGGRYERWTDFTRFAGRSPADPEIATVAFVQEGGTTVKPRFPVEVRIARQHVAQGVPPENWPRSEWFTYRFKAPTCKAAPPHAYLGRSAETLGREVLTKLAWDKVVAAMQTLDSEPPLSASPRAKRAATQGIRACEEILAINAEYVSQPMFEQLQVGMLERVQPMLRSVREDRDAQQALSLQRELVLSSYQTNSFLGSSFIDLFRSNGGFRGRGLRENR
jgi:hypothetical protein